MPLEIKMLTFAAGEGVKVGSGMRTWLARRARTACPSRPGATMRRQEEILIEPSKRQLEGGESVERL